MKFFIILISVLTFSYEVSAAAIGKIVFLKGKAHKISKGTIDQVSLKMNDEIFEGDKLFSKEKSIVRVKMTDDSVLTFGPNTQFNFRKYVFEENEKRLMNYNLVYGKLRAKFSKKKKKANITVETKTISMGIRGTEILLTGQVDEHRSAAQAALIEGKAIIVDKSKDNKIIKLVPGQTYMVAVDSNIGRDRGELLDIGKMKYEALANAGGGLGGAEMGLQPVDDGEIALGSSQEPSVEELEAELFLDNQNMDDLFKDKN